MQQFTKLQLSQAFGSIRSWEKNMIKLESVTKPLGDLSASRAAELADASEPLVHPGSKGSASDAPSRAETHYVVVGKSDRPLGRQFSSGDAAAETVIDVDTRSRVLETDLAPWRMVAALRMLAATGSRFIGTGWLAGPRTVITAGHCVHQQSAFGGWAENIEVSAGRNGPSFPFRTVLATRFSSLDRWIEQEDPDFDIGCIHLEEPLGNQVGFFTFASPAPSVLESHLVNISGYPGDLGNGTQQYFSANRVLRVGDRRVFYDVDTFGGQSGSPVWIQEAQGAPPTVIGIHAYGDSATPQTLGQPANSAPRIIPEVFDRIAAWVAEDSAGLPHA
jgi:glutamyl endopeptidase